MSPLSRMNLECGSRFRAGPTEERIQTQTVPPHRLKRVDTSRGKPSVGAPAQAIGCDFKLGMASDRGRLERIVLRKATLELQSACCGSDLDSEFGRDTGRASRMGRDPIGVPRAPENEPTGEGTVRCQQATSVAVSVTCTVICGSR